MDSGLKSISSLFSGANKFIIPKYQRAYAWENEQWKDFWEDILYHTPNQKYFFGTILLKEGKVEEDFDTLEVVDGQQRLTTISIFIYCLIKRLKLIDPKRDLDLKADKYIQYRGVFKLRISDLDNEFFQTYILKEKKPIKFETPSQRRLWESKVYFDGKFKDIIESEIKRMLEMLEKSDILVYSVKDSAEATLIFQTTNDRGKGLTNLDKIKSYLMYRAYLSAEDTTADIIANINSRFGEIFRAIERINPLFSIRGVKEVDEDQICQYHYISEYRWGNRKEYQNYFTSIKEYLDSSGREGKHKEVTLFIEDYTNSLKETFLVFEQILSHRNKNLNDIIFIGQIAIFFPLLIKAFKYDKSDVKENFEEILESLEKFSFRFYFFNRNYRKDMRYSFNYITLSFNGDFSKLYENIVSEIPGNCSLLIPTLKSADLYQIFNHSGALRYLFWKYENYLRLNFQPKSGEMAYEEFNDSSYKYRITIDHITAQKPLNRLKFPKRSKKFEEQYLNSLGNLTIAPQSSNSSMGTALWKEKNTYYFEKAAFKTQLELSSFIDDRTQKWDESTIAKREKKILEFALDKWGLAVDKI